MSAGGYIIADCCFCGCNCCGCCNALCTNSAVPTNVTMAVYTTCGVFTQDVGNPNDYLCCATNEGFEPYQCPSPDAPICTPDPEGNLPDFAGWQQCYQWQNRWCFTVIGAGGVFDSTPCDMAQPEPNLIAFLNYGIASPAGGDSCFEDGLCPQGVCSRMVLGAGEGPVTFEPPCNPTFEFDDAFGVEPAFQEICLPCSSPCLMVGVVGLRATMLIWAGTGSPPSLTLPAMSYYCVWMWQVDEWILVLNVGGGTCVAPSYDGVPCEVVINGIVPVPPP